MDCIVLGVAKSQTRLSNFHSFTQGVQVSRASLLERMSFQQTIKGDEGAIGYMGKAFQMVGTSKMKEGIS